MSTNGWRASIAYCSREELRLHFQCTPLFWFWGSCVTERLPSPMLPYTCLPTRKDLLCKKCICCLVWGENHIHTQAQIQWAVQILCSFSYTRCCFFGELFIQNNKSFLSASKTFDSLFAPLCCLSLSTSNPPPPSAASPIRNYTFVVVSRTGLFVYSHNVMQFRVRQIFLTCIVYKNRQYCTKHWNIHYRFSHAQCTVHTHTPIRTVAEHIDAQTKGENRV